MRSNRLVNISGNLHLYIISILILISSGSLTGYLFDSTVFEIAILALSIPSMIRMFAGRLLKCLMFATCLLIYLILQHYNYPQMSLYLFRFLLLIFVFTLLHSDCRIRKVPIWSVFYKVICYYALYTLVMWFFISILGFTFGRTLYPTSAYKVDVYDYFHIFYTYTSKTAVPFGLSMYRNYGIFSEPGLNSIFLSFALFYGLFVDKKKNTFMLFTLTVSLIVTFSTTGLSYAVILFACKAFKAMNRKRTKVLLLILVPLAIVGVWYACSYLLMEKSTEHAGSYLARLYDLTDGFTLFTQKPLLGYGFGNQDVYYQFLVQNSRYSRYYHQANSNGIITIMFTQGVLGLALLAIPIVKILRRRENRLINILFVVWFLFCFMSEPGIVMTIGAFSLGSGYADCMLKKLTRVNPGSLQIFKAKRYSN